MTAPRAEGRQPAQPAMAVFVLAFLIALGVALSVGLLLFDPPPHVDVRQVPCAWVAALPWLLYGAAALALLAAVRQIGRGLWGPSQCGGWRAAWLVVQVLATAAVSWWVASVVNAILLSVIMRVAGCAA